MTNLPQIKRMQDVTFRLITTYCIPILNIALDRYFHPLNLSSLFHHVVAFIRFHLNKKANFGLIVIILTAKLLF